MMKLLNAVALYYRDDPSTASVTCAWLPETGMYYASICRYHERYGGAKEVVCNATANDLDTAIDALCNKWNEVTHGAE